MQDQHMHGILTTQHPAQTYCGLSTVGLRATTDPFSVTCPSCKSIMNRTSNKYGQVREPGRPKKRSKFG